MNPSVFGRIKADAIQNLTDARYFAAWGLDYLGFCLDVQAPDYLAAQEISIIRSWVSGPKAVGELTARQNHANALALQKTFNFAALELAPNANFVEAFSDLRLTDLILRVSLSSFNDLQALSEHLSYYNPFVHHFILEDLGPYQAQDLKPLLSRHDCSIRAHWSAPSDLALWHQAGARGFCFRGGAEERTGYKSFEDLDLYMEEIYPSV